VSDEFAANFPLLVSSAQARGSIARQLRLYVGRGRRYSVKELANATGVRDWMINQALIPDDDPKHRPLTHEALQSIGKFLGADFLNGCLAHCGVGVFDLPDAEFCPGELAADNTDDNATLVRAAMDLQFDDDETPDLVKVGNRMMQRGACLIALGRMRPPPNDERK